MVTLLAETRPVVTETYESENQQISEIAPFSDFWKYPDIDARNKKNAFSTESHALITNLLSETSMKEIEYVVTKKHEFDNRDDSV